MGFQIGQMGASPPQGGQDAKRQMAEKLKGLGIPEDVIQQGSTAVQEYAQTNGIELTTSNESQSISATEQAQNPFQMGNQQSNKEDFDAQLVALGIPQATVAQGQEAVKAYAEENNIELPPPPQKGMQLEIMA